MSQDLYLAIDLGGTRCRVAAFAGDRLLERYSGSSDPERGVAAVLDDLAERLGKIASGYGRAVAVGVATPGPVDPWSGILYTPPNMPGWEMVEIDRELEERTGLPIVVGNDANYAALGEATYGAGQGKRSVCYFTVSTGVGGGIIDEGRLVVGGHGFAAEFGHQTIVPDGPVCKCGGRGHLEALASGTAIARIAREQLRFGMRSLILALAGGCVEDVTAVHVMSAARRGDGLAQAIVRDTVRYLSIGIANVIVALDPQVVVLGGGVMQSADLLLEPLREQTQRLVMPGIRGKATIEVAQLGDDAGLWGAYVAARQRFPSGRGESGGV